jgi:hypothetical protein
MKEAAAEEARLLQERREAEKATGQTLLWKRLYPEEED